MSYSSLHTIMCFRFDCKNWQGNNCIVSFTNAVNLFSQIRFSAQSELCRLSAFPRISSIPYIIADAPATNFRVLEMLYGSNLPNTMRPVLISIPAASPIAQSLALRHSFASLKLRPLLK